MNNSIFAMNHSPKMEERESQILPHERDITALYNDFAVLTDCDTAAEFCLEMTGLPYDEKCAALVNAIEAALNNAPVNDLDAMIAFADDTEAPKLHYPDVAETVDDPREDDYASDRGDALRESKYGKGL